jgi:hypothetical protein
MYWDLGPNEMERLMEEHMRSCATNRVCTQLKLATTIFEAEDDGTSRHPSAEKPNVEPSVNRFSDIQSLLNPVD